MGVQIDGRVETCRGESVEVVLSLLQETLLVPELVFEFPSLRLKALNRDTQRLTTPGKGVDLLLER